MLSIMNEIDHVFLLPLCVLYEIQNQIYQQLASPSKAMLPPKIAPKRKGTGKDRRPTKKGTGQPYASNSLDTSQKVPTPPRHGAGKGLMIAQGPISSNPIQRLVSHKENAEEMVNSIIKDMDMDECVNHVTEELGVSGLFNLVGVSIHWLFFSFFFFFFCNYHPFVGYGEDKGPTS